MTATRPYHHGSLATALVEAGLELTRTGGPSALGLREATRRAGVSPTAAYRHFADRRALLQAVAQQVQVRMADRMRRRVELRSNGRARRGESPDPSDEARRRLEAVGVGYVDFALVEPGWFAVAFGDEWPTTEPDGPSAAPYALLVDALDGLVHAGVMAPDRRAGAEWPCWSTVHGFALLALHGPLREVPMDDVLVAARHSVRTIVDGLLVG